MTTSDAPTRVMLGLAASVADLTGAAAGAQALHLMSLMLATARYAPEWAVATWEQLIALAAEADALPVGTVAAEYEAKVTLLVEEFPARSER